MGKSDLNLCAKNANLFLTEPLSLRRFEILENPLERPLQLLEPIRSIGGIEDKVLTKRIFLFIMGFGIANGLDFGFRKP